MHAKAVTTKQIGKASSMNIIATPKQSMTEWNMNHLRRLDHLSIVTPIEGKSETALLKRHVKTPRQILGLFGFVLR
jgi:hypothetical protein